MSRFFEYIALSHKCHTCSYTVLRFLLRSQLGGSKALRGALRGFRNLGLFEAVNSSGSDD